MSSEESHEISLATVRRVPRYSVFMTLGAILGIVVAFLLTVGGSGGFSVLMGGEMPTTSTGVQYSFGQVFGFAILYLVPVGIAVGALAAVLIERLARRHDRVVRVDRETIVEVDDHSGAEERPEASAS